MLNQACPSKYKSHPSQNKGIDLSLTLPSTDPFSAQARLGDVLG